MPSPVSLCGHGGDGARQAIRGVINRLRNSPANRPRYDRGRSIVGDPEAPAYRPVEFLHPLLARSVPLYSDGLITTRGYQGLAVGRFKL